MNSSPLDKEEIREAEFFYERDILKSNIRVYTDMFEFAKDSFECFLIMSRQKERKSVEENEFTLLLKYINKCRYNIGIVIEEIRVHDKNITDRVISRKID